MRRSSSRSSRGNTCTSPTWSGSPEARPHRPTFLFDLRRNIGPCSAPDARPERTMRPLSRSLATSGLSSKRGTSPESELVPSTRNRHARWRRQRARTSRQRGGPTDTARQQVVRVEVVASGRRRVPSAVERARMADGKRGVNDPGVAWPVRPQTIGCGGRSRPAVSMSDEAREQPPSSGGSAGTGR